jgi:hypothetical protein
LAATQANSFTQISSPKEVSAQAASFQTAVAAKKSMNGKTVADSSIPEAQTLANMAQELEKSILIAPNRTLRPHASLPQKATVSIAALEVETLPTDGLFSEPLPSEQEAGTDITAFTRFAPERKAPERMAALNGTRLTLGTVKTASAPPIKQAAVPLQESQDPFSLASIEAEFERLLGRTTETPPTPPKPLERPAF